jgi:lipoprotein-releasing system permease protein
MRLTVLIAFRYLFSKKKINAINIITFIAMIGFGVGSFAMIVVLSAFNGFENVVQSMISNYDPNLKITPKEGKFFPLDTSLHQKIATISGVKNVSFSLTEKVVFSYDQKQEVGEIRGLDSSFPQKSLEDLVFVGNVNLNDSIVFKGIVGGVLANKLGFFPGGTESLGIYVPKRGAKVNTLNPLEALNYKNLYISGVFTVHEEVDAITVIAPLTFVQELLEMPRGISAIEVRTTDGVNHFDKKAEIQEIIGSEWVIKTREEQNELLYKVFKSERWLTFAVLAMVLLVSSFNIFGSLMMIVLDKKKDLSVLKSMGIQKNNISKIFLIQGTLIAAIGGGIGLVTACFIVWGQSVFGWIKLQNSIIDSYPVALKFGDVLLTTATFLILGFLMSLYPSIKAGKMGLERLN